VLFNSFEFIAFFTIIALIYYLLPKSLQWIWLLIGSIFFYMYSQLALIIIPLSIIIITYLCGYYIEKSAVEKRKKYIYLAGIIANISFLLLLKYFNFFSLTLTSIFNSVNTAFFKSAEQTNHPFLLNLAVPLGISYITFQAMGYLIEVYRGTHPAEKNFGHFITYLLFFPKIVAGPVERAHHFLPQIKTGKSFDYDTIVLGLRLMLWGFFKKLVIADRLELYNSSVLDNYSHHNSITLAFTAVLCAIQLYADFSGYTDIALGLAKVLGFDLTPNFNRPFFSKSITEFWRKWHISLSKWFLDYVYTGVTISLRDWGKWSPIFALNITFILLGLWHGPNWTFVIFGMLQGLALTLEFLTRKSRKKLREKLPVAVNTLVGVFITFGYFCFSLIFFRANSVKQALTIIGKIFQASKGSIFIGSVSTMFYAIIGVTILFITEYFQENHPKFLLINNRHRIVRHATYVTLILLIILFGVFNESQFIYFKF